MCRETWAPASLLLHQLLSFPLFLLHLESEPLSPLLLLLYVFMGVYIILYMNYTWYIYVVYLKGLPRSCPLQHTATDDASQPAAASSVASLLQLILRQTYLPCSCLLQILLLHPILYPYSSSSSSTTTTTTTSNTRTTNSTTQPNNTQG